MSVICITGGLASGKSTATLYLAEQGAEIIDADKLGHRAYDSGTQAYYDVIATFGEDLRAEDGSIDRRVLGKKVFGDSAQLKKLTDIVWPEIRKLAQNEIDANDSDTIMVLEAAVLLEAGWQDIGDEIWVVTVDPEIAITRCMSRDGLEKEPVQSRLDAQLSNDERVAQADIVIVNNGSEEELLEQLDEQWHRLMSEE